MLGPNLITGFICRIWNLFYIEAGFAGFCTKEAQFKQFWQVRKNYVIMTHAISVTDWKQSSNNKRVEEVEVEYTNEGTY